MRLIPVCLAGLVVGCSRTPPPPAAPAPAGPAVGVVKPERRSVRRVVEQPGAVQAFEEVELVAKLPGYVKAVAADPAKAGRADHDRLIDIGSRVAAGQVLAEVAVPELDEEAKQKDALVKQAEAEVEQSRKALAAAAAGVAAAEALVVETRAGLARARALNDRWQSEAGRIAGLVKTGVIDSQTRDETQNQFKAAEAGRAEAAAKVSSAEAAVAKAKADRDKAAADVAAAGARADVARAEVRRVAALLGYTRLTAPFAGVVTRRAVSPGDFVGAGGRAGGVFRVARVDPVRVVVQVPEADAGLVAEGRPVRVAVQALGGPDVASTVARTSWSLEPGSRTLRAEIDLPNPDGRVRPGMYVYARVTAELPEAWSLPAAAVHKLGDEHVVYRVVEGKAVRTPVEVVRGDGQFTQVRRYKKSASTDWADWTGGEAVASPAAACSDGQPIPPG